MTLRERYLVGALVLALALGGWLLQQQAQWKQTYYNQTVSLLLDDVRMARIGLERILEMESPERRAEALGQVHGYLASASLPSEYLYQTSAPPPRTGKPVHPWVEIGRYTHWLLQYAQELSPDMTEAELRYRLELLHGLEQALLAGINGEWHPYSSDWSVNEGKLVQAWFGYVKGFEGPPETGWVFDLWVEVTAPKVKTQSLLVDGEDALWDLQLDLTWDRTYRTWPSAVQGFLVLHASEPLSLVGAATSDQPYQDQLGREAVLNPVSGPDDIQPLLWAFENHLPETWDPERLLIIRVLPGLNQRISMQVRGGEAEVEALYLHRTPYSNWRAMPVAP